MKMQILKSVSNSDEDNFAEHVEFNEGQHRRRAIFGYGVDSGDQKVLIVTGIISIFHELMC